MQLCQKGDFFGITILSSDIMIVSGWEVGCAHMQMRACCMNPNFLSKAGFFNKKVLSICSVVEKYFKWL